MYKYIIGSWKAKGDVWKENNEQTKNKREERRHPFWFSWVERRVGEGV